MNVRPLGLLALAILACGGRSSKGTDAGDDTRTEGDAPADVVATGGAGTMGAAGGSGGGGTGGGAQVPDAGTGDARDGAGDATDAIAATDGAGDAGADAVSASGSPLRALAVSTGVTDACALLDNHRVKCWGSNAYGSLGTGNEHSLGAAAEMGNALPFVDLGTGRTATAIASGRYHSCAILDDGNVKCWGFFPMTGQPPRTNTQVGLGDEPGEMGDALPALKLGGHKAKQIACGYFLSCALVDDGSVWCWGEGKQEPVDMKVPATFEVRQLAAAGGVVALLEDGTVANVNGFAPGISLLANDRAMYVAGSMGRLCAVLVDGSVKCGESEVIDTPHDLAAIGVGMSSLRCGLSKTGDVRCWGASNCAGRSPSGSLYPPGTIYWCPSAPLADKSFAVGLGQKAVAVTSGGLDHMCALLADGGVKCWTTYDQCPNASGGTNQCPVPPKPSVLLGGSVEVTGTGPSRKWGAWRAIDLGTHP
jgi:hypothetical protein